jgi:hypothetical protein
LTVFDSAAFPHTMTGFSLDGHAALSDGTSFACRDCHTQGISSFDPQTCTDCHALLNNDFTVAHTLDFGQDCLACHDGLDRYGDFDHSQTAFPLLGAHQQASCSGCHPDAHTIPDLQNTPGTCVACHLAEDAHAGMFGIDCGACHSTQAWTPAQFDHSQTDFPLIGKHAETACQDCHNGSYQGTPKDCYACHQSDDQHNGAYGTACESCHNPSGWEDITFDHSLSAFVLDGAHVEVECLACHIDNRFKGTPQECTACHAEPDYHAGMFAGQPCSACHTTTAWSPALYDGPHTFPIDHGEQNNTCADCHQPNLTQWTCYTCHERGETDRKHLEEGIADFSDCLRCHPTGQKEENNGGESNDDD